MCRAGRKVLSASLRVQRRVPLEVHQMVGPPSKTELLWPDEAPAAATLDGGLSTPFADVQPFSVSPSPAGALVATAISTSSSVP